MNTKILLSLRSLFVVLCCFIGGATALILPQMQYLYLQSILGGLLVGCLGVIFELLIKSLSLRTLISALLGIAVGAFISFLLLSLPFFGFIEQKFPLYSLILYFSIYAIPTYIGMITFVKREKETGSFFNRSVPIIAREVYTAKTVLDLTSLIDGRIVGICENHFLPSLLIIPRFVLQELESMSKSPDQVRSIKGQKGLAAVEALSAIKHVTIDTEEATLNSFDEYLNGILAFTKNQKAKLLTTDFSLAQKAETQNIPWLNLSALAKALSPELSVGESFEVELVKKGKEETQAIGYLCDGSMVVVNEAANMIGRAVTAEVVSILPSAGGKMVFAKVS